MNVLIRSRGPTQNLPRGPPSPRGAGGRCVTWSSGRGRVVPAVDGITFRIERGEMVGCIGPNGAGKSTTIKMLTGILVPSSGRVEVARLVPPPAPEDARPGGSGVVFGQRTQLWWDLPLIESLELLRFIYRVPADRHRGQPGLLHGGYWSWRRSWTRRYVSFRSASGCAAISRRPCCTIPRFSILMSRPSASTW